MSLSSNSYLSWMEEQDTQVPSNKEGWEGPLAYLDENPDREHFRRWSVMRKRGRQPWVPQWRLDYTEEDWLRECRQEAQEELERVRLREQNRRRMTPSPTPPPETASAPVAHQTQQTHQVQQGHQAGAGNSIHTALTNNADDNESDMPSSVVVAPPPALSRPIATVSPVSLASALPSPPPSRKRKRQEELLSPIPFPSKRVTRSHSNQETVFYEVDNHMRSRAVEPDGEEGKTGQKELSVKRKSLKRKADQSYQSLLPDKIGTKPKSYMKDRNRAGATQMAAKKARRGRGGAIKGHSPSMKGLEWHLN